MFSDPLLQKAWEVRRQAEHFSLEVLLEAAVWLEEKYRQSPSKEIAVALALQYFILAMRRTQKSRTTTKEYFSRAMHWREEAKRTPTARQLLPALFTLN
jgi:hypothetical protein